jgi:transposase-like protein
MDDRTQEVLKSFRSVVAGIKDDLEFLNKKGLPESQVFVERQRLAKKLESIGKMTFRFLDKSVGFGREIKSARIFYKEVLALL